MGNICPIVSQECKTWTLIEKDHADCLPLSHGIVFLLFWVSRGIMDLKLDNNWITLPWFYCNRVINCKLFSPLQGLCHTLMLFAWLRILVSLNMRLLLSQYCTVLFNNYFQPQKYNLDCHDIISVVIIVYMVITINIISSINPYK